MSREVWRQPGVDPLLDPRFDEVLHTGELPLVGHGPRRAAPIRKVGPMTDKRKRAARTALQVLLGVAVMLPVLLDATGLKPQDVPLLAGIVAASAVFARIMASDVVEAALERWLGGRLTIPTAPTLPSKPLDVDGPEVVEGADSA